MNLSTILAKINKLKPALEDSVEGGPIETLNSRMGRKASAKESYKQLREDYRLTLLNSAVFILATGPNNKEFTEIATSKFGCFSTNPEGLYEDLSSKIVPSLLKGRETIPSLFSIVGRTLEEKALEIGVIGYPMLIYKAKYGHNVSDKKSFINLLKRAFNDQVGAEMVAFNTISTLTDTLIEKGHKDAVTPIVLSVDDPILVSELSEAFKRIAAKLFVVSTGQDVKNLKNPKGPLFLKDTTEESVGQALKAIKNNLKK